MRLLFLLLLLSVPAVAAITYFGSASTPSDNSSSTTAEITITPPSSMADGDLAVISYHIRYGGSSSDIVMSETGGQYWVPIAEGASGSVTWKMFLCRFNGTWSASPKINNQYYAGYPSTGVLHVFRPSSSSVMIDLDASPADSTFAAGSTPFAKTITGLTTRTNDALVFATWFSADANTWDSLTGGWSTPGSNQYRNTGGSYQSITSAYKVQATAGSSGDVAKNQATLGGDAGVSFIMAFSEVAFPSVSSSTTVDLYTDMEAGSNGDAITTTMLGTSTHGTGGTWSENGSPRTSSKIATAAEKQMGRSVTAAGSPYDDTTSTRGFWHDHNYSATAGHYRYTFTAAKNAVSLGFMFSTSVDYLTYDSYAWNGFYDTGGSFLVLGFGALWDGYHGFRLHSSFGGDSQWYAPIYRNTWYWCSVKYDYPNAVALTALFDTSTWKQIGFRWVQPLTSPAATTISNINWGSTTGGTATTNNATYFDDLIADWTTATFPLLPGTVSTGRWATTGKVHFSGGASIR